jgi:hypothetical protein
VGSMEVTRGFASNEIVLHILEVRG